MSVPNPSFDRIALVRQLIETDDPPPPEVFAPDFKNNTPWELATQDYVKEGEPKPSPQNVFDSRQLIEEISETSDTVVVNWRLRGRWIGPLPFAPSIPPTGAEVDFTGRDVYRFVGNQIVEKDGEFDVKTASRQLLSNLKITCGSMECVEVVQSLSRRVSLPPEPLKPVATAKDTPQQTPAPVAI